MAQGHLPTRGLVSRGQQLSQELPVATKAMMSYPPPRGPAVPLLGVPEAFPRTPSSLASQKHQPQWVVGPKWQGGLASSKSSHSSRSGPTRAWKPSRHSVNGLGNVVR